MNPGETQPYHFSHIQLFKTHNTFITTITIPLFHSIGSAPNASGGSGESTISTSASHGNGSSNQSPDGEGEKASSGRGHLSSYQPPDVQGKGAKSEQTNPTILKSTRSEAQLTPREKKLKRASSIVAIVTACLFVSIMPIITYNAITAICPDCLVIDQRYKMALSVLGNSNSVMNFIIYMVKDKPFRKSILNAFKCPANS